MNLLKTLSRRTLLIFTIAGLIISLLLFAYLVYRSSKDKDSILLALNRVDLHQQEKINIALPIRIKIQSIAVDSVFEYVGVTPEGAMDVPKGRDNIAWFDLGPRPGEVGSAVVAGHSGFKDNKKAVFDDLYKLRKGDKISIEDDKGVVSTFVVRESRKYNPEADASSVFVSNDGIAHLNLVTCVGLWNEKEKTHSERLVVFSDLESI